MTECIKNSQYNTTLQQSSKVIFDGTNNSQIQNGQNINVFIGNVVTQITNILALIAGLTVTPEDIDTTGISSSVVDPSGKTLAEWLTDVSTVIEGIQTDIAGLEASDISYAADYGLIGEPTPTTIEEALNGLLEYIENFKQNDLYDSLQKIEMPLYPFYTGSLTITDVTVTTPKINIADLEGWARNGYFSKQAEDLDLTDEKDNYIFIPSGLTLVTTMCGVKYGYMYNWFALTNAAEITSSATWRVSTKTDWDTLIAYIGGASVAGGKLKTTRTEPADHPRFDSPNTGATNLYNFTGVPSGQRNNVAGFSSLGTSGIIWTATQKEPNYSYIVNLVAGLSSIEESFGPQIYGHAARTIRDATVAEQLLADGTYCTPYTGNDGRKYNTIKIGTQVWLATNLAETKYRDGTFIPNITDQTAWEADTTGAYCAYDNDESNALLFASDITDFPNKYNVKTSAIGGAAPASDDILVAKITVTGGVVGTPTIVLKDYPVQPDLIADDAVSGRNIDCSNTFSAAFTQDVVTKIISPVVKNSIELNSNVPQLKNDSATPGNTKYYGTNGAGTKGWFGFPYYASATDDFIQFSDGSNGFKEVNNAYAQAKYEGNGAFTFGIRSEAVGDNSFVMGTADATKGEFATGSNNTVQSSHIELETETVDATPTYMTIDGEFMEFREDTLSRVSIEVCAVDFTTSVAAIFDTLTFGVLNDGGTLTIPKNTPGAQSENATYSDLTTIQYEVEIVSDVLYIKVTGKGGSTIRWAAKVSKVEVNNKTNLS